MQLPLRVLIVEDCPADAVLILHELRRAGFDPIWQRVDTAADYAANLSPDLDVILSDFSMPTFSGMRALEMLHERGWEIPFVLVSGTIGEDTAVAAMQKGAADYLLKDRLTRLGPAIQHALERGRLRRERSRAVEGLRLFRTLVDESNDTFEVIDPETSRFLDVNENGPLELGCTREEYLSLRVTDIDPMFDQAGWAQLVEKLRAAGSLNGEGVHRRKDGTTFPIEFSSKWVHLDRDYIVTVVRNITERRRAEEALRRNESLLRSITDHSGDIIAVKDREGRYLFMNPAGYRAGGFPPEAVIGHTDVEYHTDREQALRFMADDRRIMESRQGETYEEHFVSRDGETCLLLTNKMPRLDAQGQVLGIIVICRDITERKRLEQEVLEISAREQRRIGQDLHDDLCQWLVGTELLSVALAKDLAEKSPVDAARALKVADGLRQAIARARMLARGLAPATIESQGLAGALRELASNAGEIFHILCFFDGPETVQVRDEVALHLYRIAQEAISNAVRHGKAREVRLILQPNEDRVSLRIRDDGCGLPQPLPQTSGMGLRTMRYRAGMIGATLEIRPTTSGGTEIACTFPKEP